MWISHMLDIIFKNIPKVGQFFEKNLESMHSSITFPGSKIVIL